jgi:hypothetical protein
MVKIDRDLKYLVFPSPIGRMLIYLSVFLSHTVIFLVIDVCKINNKQLAETLELK